MRKKIVMLVASLLLIGAGCASTAPSTPKEAAQAEVQAAWDAYIAAAQKEDDATVESFVSGELDPFDLGQIEGYYSTQQPTIYWATSTWSVDLSSVALVSTDGEQMGTWTKAGGLWKATDPVWWD